jgi:DNA-binding transcriptional LysR family regulator
MSHVPQTELEQWAVLRTVVEAGSFAKAAQQLNRSQSSVSYAIARLQERLGVALLHVDGRRALLTDAGQLLLAEAVPLIDDLQRLEQRGKLIAKGQEPRIRLVVDSIFPKWLLFDALVAFHTTHRYVEIRLSEVVRRPVPNPAAEPFDLAVTVWDFKAGPARPLMDIEMIAVARPDHPLHARRGRLTLGPLSRHAGLVIEGQPAALSSALEQGLHWRVNTLESAVEAVRRGLCHGWLPRHMVEGDIERGELKPLPLTTGATRSIPLTLAYAVEDMAGPLTRTMADLLRKACAAGRVPSGKALS